MARNSFTLEPVTAADFTDIAKISSNSFANDRHTLMKSHHAVRHPYNHENASREPLAGYFTFPERYQLIKAVEDTSGTIMGSVTWGFRGYTKESVPTLNGRGVGSAESKQKSRADMAVADASAKEKPAYSAKRKTEEGSQSMIEEDTNRGEDDPIKRLTSKTDADMKRWQEILMPEGTKCMFIVGLSVAPEYHGLGVGTALLRWGTANADADGVFCWVHSSESAHTFYAKEGFVTVGILEIDLDEFALGPLEGVGGDGKWGRYVFRYMKRLPIKEI